MRIFNEAEPPWSNLSEILGPAARPLGVRQYPEALKGCGVKTLQYRYTSLALTHWSLEDVAVMFDG